LRGLSFEEPSRDEFSLELSFEELSFEELSFDELSFDELSFEALSFDEESFEELSDLDLSSFLSFEEESPLPEDPGEEDFLA
jgi:hypothetical protein